MQTLFENAALAAGRAIMDVFHGNIAVALKADASPVTEADRQAEAIILAALSGQCPDIPVVAEEATAAGQVPDISAGRFILVDPLDGTKEFIKRHDDFTVNIALVEGGVPIAGVVYAPALGVLYAGDRSGAIKATVTDDHRIVDRRAIVTRPPESPPRALVSRSHLTDETTAFLAERGIRNVSSIGSSLKFCLMAEGRADLYPRFGRTMEWDTAAGDAVLRAAGGITRTVDGEALGYGKTAQANDADFANPYFIAWAKP